MADDSDKKHEHSSPGEAHDRHHARKRRARRDAARAAKGGTEDDSRQYLYGLHTVRHALENPARRKYRLLATRNALSRLGADETALASTPAEICEPKAIDRLAGEDAVHQGVLLECEPLLPIRLDEAAKHDLVLVLDQVTDPHNVGAVMRSAVACGAGAVVMTARHSPAQGAVLAKAASGALDLIDRVEVRNLAEALEELKSHGFRVIGLDSDGEAPLEETVDAERIALVLGAEGKGLREKTRQTCDLLARIDLPGEIRSLNVSNAAILALYVTGRALNARRQA